MQFSINPNLIQTLIHTQFPKWKNLPICPVEYGGWDNRTFHLGEELVIRMPSAEKYAKQIEKEIQWLPKLQPFLPLEIPEPMAIGAPNENYPWKWAIYRWIKGENAALGKVFCLDAFARELASFLNALQKIDPQNGPIPGEHNFYRGGSLGHYDHEVRQALSLLKNRIDMNMATEIWETALSSSWQNPPVWVHGDISEGNLILQSKELRAVIDFGLLAIGDPACDLAIAWTMFKNGSREVFRQQLQLDENTWNRGRGWALWKALVIASGLSKNPYLEKQAWFTLQELKLRRGGAS